MQKLPSNIIMADASGENVKVAMFLNGECAREMHTGAQAMESFAQAVAQICPNPFDLNAFFICEGPGSMLGTRTASAFIASVCAVTGAEIYTWGSLQTAAAILNNRGVSDFSIVAPSRKGCVNLLNFSGGKTEFEREIETPQLAELSKDKKFLLRQRKNTDSAIADIQEIEFSLKEVFEAIKASPALAEKRTSPPDAKSLSKREYVKWKAQALI